MQKVLLALLRHALTVFGGVGLVSDSQLNVIAGALLTIIGVAWSILEKRLREKSQ